MDDAIRIATEVADALDYAHRQGVIHRDIKPGNILLPEGRVLVADFGIALAVGAAGGGRLTETGLSLGTPHYMSPEQATGDQNVGPQTDTYALGCVLYEMLVGEPPYTGPNAQAVLGQIIIADPVSAAKKRASIPPNVDAAIRKALEKLPADRFGSTQEFSHALGDAGTGTPTTSSGIFRRRALTVGFLAAPSRSSGTLAGHGQSLTDSWSSHPQRSLTAICSEEARPEASVMGLWSLSEGTGKAYPGGS